MTLQLASLPTPLQPAERLTEAWGGPTILIKRDDLTGFGLSGNKVRKLDHHFALAKADGASTVITCGAVQSNHCRATAVAAAQLGMRCLLLLRSPDGRPPRAIEGNNFLQRLMGAQIHYITPTQYDDRVDLMNRLAAKGKAAGQGVHIIPEGASDRHGMEAFAHAAHEVLHQCDELGVSNPILWHASSSGGTTAGLALGATSHPTAATVVGTSVGDTATFLSSRVWELLAESTEPQAPFTITDAWIGNGYGRTTDAELAIQVAASRLTGLIWDPTYTGKAVFALHEEVQAGRFNADDTVVLWHTGGGFAAFSHDFSRSL